MSFGTNNNANFYSHLYKYIGETVTVFTASGGASGCGFSGILLSINCNYLRLSTQQGTSPANPLSESICGDDYGYDGDEGCGGCGGRYKINHNHSGHSVGSVCDIPLCQIVAFCHNAI